MSFRHIAVVLSVSLGVTLLARAAASEDRLITLVSAGTADASDVGYTINQNSGGSHDCDCCCDDVCGCGPRWHWSGGVEATYLNPAIREEGIFRIVDPGWTAAPRIWLGVENCNGWGARVRYWQLCANRKAFGGEPQEDVLEDLSQNLDMYDIDGELTRRLDWGCWKLLGAFGGRYASVERLRVFNHLISPDFSQFVATDTQTDAGGLTFALELSRPIGCTGVEAFGTLRVSPLWGSFRFAGHSRINNDGNLLSQGSLERFGTDLTIWEAQVGLQCSKYLACCSGTVFARCGFEYQSWMPSNQNLELGVNPDINLYGVAVAVGITR